jgi:hypothetical protein
MQTNYLSNSILDHVVKGVPYTPPMDIYVGLFNQSPNYLGAGGVEVSAPSYARVKIRDLMNLADFRMTVNASRIEFPIALEGWGQVTAVGIWDSLIGGNLLYFSRQEPFSVVTNDVWQWEAGKFKIVKPGLHHPITNWADRPLSVYEGYPLVFTPTNATYRYSSAIKDYVREEFYVSYDFKLVASLTGDNLPTEDTVKPFEIASDNWTIFNDGQKNWVRSVTTDSTTAWASSNHAYPKGSYFFQGYAQVTNVNTGLSQLSSCVLFTDGFREVPFGFSSRTFLSNLGFIRNANTAESVRFFSTSTLTPVWVEGYFIRHPTLENSFNLTMYANHSQFASEYSSSAVSYNTIVGGLPTLTQGGQFPEAIQIVNGHTTAFSDTRIREFRTGYLARKI